MLMTAVWSMYMFFVARVSGCANTAAVMFVVSMSVAAVRHLEPKSAILAHGRKL